MNSWRLGGVLTLALGAVIGIAAQTPPARALAGVQWLDSWDAAHAAARQAKKPIFLVFR